MGQDSADDDFADFQTPSPVSTIISIMTSASASISTGTAAAAPTSGATAWPADSPWYAIWQRHGPREFLIEVYIMIILGVIVMAHTWGVRRNRAIAKEWVSTHLPVLKQEFAMVGVDSKGRPNTLNDDDEASGTSTSTSTPEGLVLEKSPVEFVSYASGRANIAFAHITIKLQRRHNPIALAGEYILAFIFDSMPAPQDTVTVTLSPFDGSERTVLTANLAPQSAPAPPNSKYDPFIFALVNKSTMKRHREERYDLSLTRTADYPEKLPRWLTTMSEAAELTTLVPTPALLASLSSLPENSFEYLIVTDQPLEKPNTLAETTSKKRITLLLPVSTSATHTIPLLTSFLRLADHLPSIKLLPNLTRKIAATREAESKKLRKVAETEQAEEREQKRAEEKKREREEKLRGMRPEEQKKFLEKEREKEIRKMQKKGAKKG